MTAPTLTDDDRLLKVRELVNASDDKRFADEAAHFAIEFAYEIGLRAHLPEDDREFKQLMRYEFPNQFARLKNVALTITFIKQLVGIAPERRSPGWR